MKETTQSARDYCGTDIIKLIKKIHKLKCNIYLEKFIK